MYPKKLPLVKFRFIQPVVYLRTCWGQWSLFSIARHSHWAWNSTAQKNLKQWKEETCSFGLLDDVFVMQMPTIFQVWAFMIMWGMVGHERFTSLSRIISLWLILIWNLFIWAKLSKITSSYLNIYTFGTKEIQKEVFLLLRTVPLWIILSVDRTERYDIIQSGPQNSCWCDLCPNDPTLPYSVIFRSGEIVVAHLWWRYVFAIIKYNMMELW